jgi:hypothetical protein
MATVTVISWYLKFKTRECKHRSATHAMPNALMPLKSKSNIQTSFLEFIIIFYTPQLAPAHRLIKSISEKSGGFLP